MTFVEIAERPQLAACRHGDCLEQVRARQGLDVGLLELKLRRLAGVRADAEHQTGASRRTDIARHAQLAMTDREALRRALALVAELEACNLRVFGGVGREHAPKHHADLGLEHGPVVVVLSHSLIVTVVVVHVVVVAVVVVAVIVMVGHLAGGAGLQRPDLLFQRPDARLVLLPQGRDLDGKDGGHRRIVVRLSLCRRRCQGDRHRRGRSGHRSRAKEHLVAHVTTPSLVVKVARRKGSRYEIL